MSGPDFITGHRVGGPSLASSGMGGAAFAYTVGRGLLLVGVTDAAADSRGESGWAPVTRVCALPEQDGEITLVLLHPQRDLLCVGTRAHGVYVTTATAPELSAATRLPLENTGETVHGAAFTSAPNAAGGAGEQEVLVLSTTFANRKGPTPHRLSLLSVETLGLLWRGATDPLAGICGLGSGGAFAGCSGGAVFVFTVETAAAEESHGSGGNTGRTSPRRAAGAASPRNKVIVLSRQCTTVDELSGEPFLRCVSPAEALSGARDEVFLALTASGHLVAFDRGTCTVVRWMDGKLSAASALALTGGGEVLLVGALLRVFTAADWEFRGKLRCDDPDAHRFCAALAVERDRLLLFSDGGGVTLVRYETGGGGNNSKSNSSAGGGKLQFTRLYRFLPLPVPPPPASDEGAAAALASWALADVYKNPDVVFCGPDGVYVFDRPTLNLRTVLARGGDGAAANVLHAYSLESDTLFVCRADGTLVAVDGQRWAECGSLALRGRVLGLCCDGGSALAALGPDSVISVLSVEAEEELDGAGRRVRMQLEDTLRCPHTHGAVRQLLFVNRQLYAVTATSVVHVNSGASAVVTPELSSTPAIVAVCAAGDDLVLATRDAVLYLDCASFRLSPLPVQLTDVRGLSFDAVCDLLSVHSARSLVVYRISEHRAVAQIEAPAGATIHTALATAKFDAVMAFVTTTAGRVARFLVNDEEFLRRSQGGSASLRSSPRPRVVPRKREPFRKEEEDAAARREDSAPSSRQLNDRFNELSGIYEKQRHQPGRGARTPRGAQRTSAKHQDPEPADKAPARASASPPRRGHSASAPTDRRAQQQQQQPQPQQARASPTPPASVDPQDTRPFPSPRGRYAPSSANTSVSQQGAALRESLAALNEALRAGDLSHSDAMELRELPGLLRATAAAIDRKNGSAPTSASASPAPAAAAQLQQKVEYLEAQNARIEEQNRAILEMLKRRK